jgi:sarcosine oxidase subunit beta
MRHDFVILGAGVYDAGTAWELARKDEDVLVLEADRTPEGASTGLGKRGIRANGRDRRELPLMREAYEIWPELEELIGKRTGYERTGHLRLVERASDGLHGGRIGLDARKWLQEQNGIPTRVLDREKVRELEPNVSDDVIGALYCPNDGVANHTATTRGLAEAADNNGAELRYDTPVSGVKHDGSKVTGVVTAEGEEVAVNDTLLVYTNLHAVQFVDEEFGLNLPVWRTLPQVMVTESLPEVPVHHLIGHDHRKLAIKEVSHNRVMISGG